MKPWQDPRVARGMTMQLAKRRERLAAGEKHLGWKMGFGAPAAMEKLGLEAPLIEPDEDEFGYELAPIGAVRVRFSCD